MTEITPMNRPKAMTAILDTNSSSTPACHGYDLGIDMKDCTGFYDAPLASAPQLHVTEALH